MIPLLFLLLFVTGASAFWVWDGRRIARNQAADIEAWRKFQMAIDPTMHGSRDEL